MICKFNALIQTVGQDNEGILVRIAKRSGKKKNLRKQK